MLVIAKHAVMFGHRSLPRGNRNCFSNRDGQRYFIRTGGRRRRLSVEVTARCRPGRRRKAEIPPSETVFQFVKQVRVR